MSKMCALHAYIIGEFFYHSGVKVAINSLTAIRKKEYFLVAVSDGGLV
jgi:hypothetical protein